jgi:hypothetical protein
MWFPRVGPVASPTGGVHLPGASSVITVNPATGNERWHRDSSPVPALAHLDDRLWLLGPNRIVVVDPSSGTELSTRPAVSRSLARLL